MAGWQRLVLKALGVVLLVVGGGLVMFGQRWVSERIRKAYDWYMVNSDEAITARRRQQRQEVTLGLAVAPLPSALPLIERPGKDVWGAPRDYVDLAGLRSLLHHEHYAELTQYLETFQRDFEADASKEYLPVDAAAAFSSAEAELRTKLDRWVSVTPQSFAPYLARGAHWVAVTWARRGKNFAAKTADSDMEAMRQGAAEARKDLQHALELAPRLVAADRLLLKVARPTSDDALVEQALQHATTQCPSCLAPRIEYMTGLQPRWGGSIEQMAQFAAAQPSGEFPRLKLLAGYSEYEQSRIARGRKDFDQAMRHAEAACAVGDNADFFLERAWVHSGREEYAEALTDIERAFEVRPGALQVRSARASMRARKNELEGSARDLIVALQVDPTDQDMLTLRPWLVKALSDAALGAYKQGKRQQAVTLIDLAEQLEPGSRDVKNLKLMVVQGETSGLAADIPSLEAAVKAHPDDFSVHQRLDYALAKHAKYDRIIAMWTEYLSRHPQDGPAYFERSGAYYNSGHGKEAQVDVVKACELGVNAACAYARKFAGKQ